MKFVKSNNYKSWIDLTLNKTAEKQDLTFIEERQKAEENAAQFENKRKAEAAKYPNVATSNEQKPGFKNEVSDESKVVEGASRELSKHLANIFGHRAGKNGKMAGIDFSCEEFRTVKAHKDVIDNSNVTDEAHVSFDVKFDLPGINRYKSAKFIVSYNQNSDDQYRVNKIFYGEDLKEYELTSASLEKYLQNTESESVKTAKAEKPIVWFNPKEDTIEEVQIVEASTKIAARMRSAGFEVDENYWVDATYNPKKFGRICTFVNVPVARADEFKRIAAWTDDEWVSRASEGGKEAKDKHMSGDEWVNRIDEKGKGYDHKDFKSGDQWVDRTKEKGPENPYGSEKAIMLSGSKKEAEKKEEVKEPTKQDSITDKLEKLLG